VAMDRSATSLNRYQLTALANKVVFVEMVRRPATPENPLGLLFTSWQVFDEAAARTKGLPDHWQDVPP